MPTLKYLGGTFECAVAIKGNDYIHLLDESGIMVAAFDNIKDFSQFTLTNGGYTSPTADHDCYLAVIRDDGTIAKGGHKCSDVLPKGYVSDSVDITDTTPTKAAKYYPLYAADKEGEQKVLANKDLYYYDTGTASYFNVGDTDQKGGLTLHASNGKYVNVVAADAPAENRDITLPDVSGTIYTTGNKPTATDVGATPYVRGTAKLTAHGWYRLFTFHGQATNNMALVMFGNTYYGSQLHPQGVSAIVNLNGYTTSSIVILSGGAKKVFSKLRVVQSGSNMVLEAYYCGTNNDTVYATAFGLGSTATFNATADNFTPSDEAGEVKVTQDIATIPSGNVLTQTPTASDVGAVSTEGGTVESQSFGALTVKRAAPGGAAVKFENSESGILGYLGVSGSKVPTFYEADATTMRTLLHTGNLDANQIGRMVSGTYTGDGNYGSTKPSQLTIGFAPKLLVVLRSGLRYSGEIGGFIWSADSGSISFGGNTLDSITTDGTTVTWYASSECIQSNERGVVYSYIAFG